MPRSFMRFFGCFSSPTKQTSEQQANSYAAEGSNERTMVQLNGVTMRHLTTSKTPCALPSLDEMDDARYLKPLQKCLESPENVADLPRLLSLTITIDPMLDSLSDLTLSSMDENTHAVDTSDDASESEYADYKRAGLVF